MGDRHGPGLFRPSPPIDDAAVFDAATSIDALKAAWNKVWSNQGCSGGDGVTLERFQRDAFRLLARLATTEAVARRAHLRLDIEAARSLFALLEKVEY